MQVFNKTLYHFHKPYINGNDWQVNDEIVIDENYNSEFITNCLGFYKDYRELIESLVTNKELSIPMLKKVHDLGLSISDIKNVSWIIKREEALEKHRLEYHSDLPSRYHSLWLCDIPQIEHWIFQLDDNSELYKLSVTGNIFVTNDEYIPSSDNGETEVQENIVRYWNPNIIRDTSKDEILFQGRIKILEKLDAEKYRRIAMETLLENVILSDQIDFGKEKSLILN